MSNHKLYILENASIRDKQSHHAPSIYIYRHLLQKYHIGQIFRNTWKHLQHDYIRPEIYLYIHVCIYTHIYEYSEHSGH